MVSALGPRFGEEGSSSEAVDFKGVQAAIEAAEALLAPGDESASAPVDEEKVLVAPTKGSSGAGGPGGELSMFTGARAVSRESTRPHRWRHVSFLRGHASRPGCTVCSIVGARTNTGNGATHGLLLLTCFAAPV